jgi:glutamyl endopeptidase
MMESTEAVWELLELEPQTARIGRETIIGRDDRKRVSNTRNYPNSAMALITFSGGRCSGWMIGPDTVATAGHCVHDGGRGGSWKQNVIVYPGRNGGQSPYGSCQATRLFSVSGWINNANEQYDYGAIKLNCAIGDRTGWLGFFWQSASLNGVQSIISGYPGDKPLQQWESRDRIRTSQSRQLFYLNDTLGGMSGSPVYTQNHPACSGFCGMAIHTYGIHGSSPHSRYNHGTRINQGVFNNLVAWRNAR